MMGEHGRTQQDLLRHADIAMYNAKKSGRNAVKVYVQKMEKEINLE
jgi:predicted signal transduction protein with EAL and GGDEF domain